MISRLRHHFDVHFEHEIAFLKGWRKNKKAVGAIMPTSKVAARRMAGVINPDSGLPVLELDPGTGVITKAILETGIKPSQLVSVEYPNAFYNRLKGRFPEVDMRLGDAFKLNEALQERDNEKFDCVISAVPLLSFPMAKRVELLEDLLARIPNGRPVIQITYGPFSPVRQAAGTLHHLSL